MATLFKCDTVEYYLITVLYITGYDVYTVVDASRPVSTDNVPNVLNDLKSRGKDFL